MADPLSMGASIIAFIEITNRIIGTCKYCIETIKDAPKDFQMILGETTSLEAIIETLRTSNVKPLGLSVTLEACHRCLASLEGLLPKTKEKYESGRRRDKISFAELAWPLKESKARKLLSEVSQHKATLLLAISGDMALGIHGQHECVITPYTQAVLVRWPKYNTNTHDIKAIRAGINNVEESLSDAVDESSPRSDLVALLATIALDQRFGNVRLLVTSRQYSDIEKVFSGISVPLSMSNSLVSGDIRQFIQYRLSKNRYIQRWPKLMGSIETSLVSGAQGMFRWAECQIYAIERLRTESQILEALQNLPEDLAETYIRIFRQIPEADRPFVRRVLIWLGGHARAPWYTSHGIKGDVLVSAASHDLRLSGLADPNFYDMEYLGELVGCLITIHKDASESEVMTNTDMAEPLNATSHQTTSDACSVSLVTLAHYTVAEFLTSSFISETDVSCFALSRSTIVAEFAESVIRQAVDADPQGAGVSWLHDREAYCLTLAPALIMDEEWPDVVGLSLRYCDPRSPHYSRILRVANFLTEIPDGWSFYFIYNMSQYHLEDHPTPDTAGEASLLLNLLLVIPISPMLRNMTRVLLERSPDLGQLLTTHLTVTLGPSYNTQSVTGTVIGTVTGTVLEIFFEYENHNRALDIMEWLAQNYSEHFNPTKVLMLLVSNCLEHTWKLCGSIVETLINHGADPNGLGCFLTPLKVAVYHGYSPVVRVLLDAGANPNFTGDFLRETELYGLPQWIGNLKMTPLALVQVLRRELLKRKNASEDKDGDDGENEDNDETYSEIWGLLLEHGALL
ncbi:ankyrin repeat protein [Apiospora arundinis]|uniref:Ankyrin repeat protein n=1 Tax=Apiospora arundinis TaxID=335852 RepID=A0ABR2IGB9_9PEZI